MDNTTASTLFLLNGAANVQVTITNDIVRAVIGTFPADGKVIISITADVTAVGTARNVAWCSRRQA